MDIVPRRGKIFPLRVGRRWEAWALVQWIIFEVRIVPRGVVRVYGCDEAEGSEEWVMERTGVEVSIEKREEWDLRRVSKMPVIRR